MLRSTDITITITVGILLVAIAIADTMAKDMLTDLPVEHPIVIGIAAFGLALTMPALTAPKVVLISLDGATPGNIEEFLEDGTLSKRRGLGLLIKRGVMTERNITITPSRTAPGHIAIATGSSAARNDITANSFHLVASPFSRNISGFSTPIVTSH